MNETGSYFLVSCELLGAWITSSKFWKGKKKTKKDPMNETWNQEPSPKLISYQFWFFIFFEINFNFF